MKLFGSMEVKNNCLNIGGVSSTDLVKEFGSPLYVMDEGNIRRICREFRDNFKVSENGNRVTYAGKAFLTVQMCKLLMEEGICLDVASGGELYTAYKAGFPLDRVLFHGNNKTIDEIRMGIELGVGRFVVDNIYEIEKLHELCEGTGKKANVLLRVTPGIEAHTHEYIKTGQVDSKFGFTLLENQLHDAIAEVIKFDNINLKGIHCHIGSQIHDIEPFVDAVSVMFDILNAVKQKHNIELPELDLGGGFGIYYTEEDNPIEPKVYCEAILKKAKEKSEELSYKMPTLIIEPGRSIVGNSGTTLYTAGSIKEVPGIRKYVAIDGGMTDNIRPSLYKAQYEFAVANKFTSEETEVVTIAGKCCESGDILIKDVKLPKIDSGDIIAVSSTGAYCYSMSSNYNKNTRAAVVMVKDGKARLICRRQSYEELLAQDLM